MLESVIIDELKNDEVTMSEIKSSESWQSVRREIN